MIQFSIGEIAEYFSEPDDNGKYHGGWVDCQIIGKFENFWLIDIPGDPTSNSDKHWATLEKNLRKKRLPRTNRDIEETRQHGLGQWDLMPWSPKEKVYE